MIDQKNSANVSHYCCTKHLQNFYFFYFLFHLYFSYFIYIFSTSIQRLFSFNFIHLFLFLFTIYFSYLFILIVFSIICSKAILMFLIFPSFFFFLQIQKRIHISLTKWQFHPTTSHCFYLLFLEKMFL